MYSHERFQADLVHSGELLINSNIGTMQARLLREHNEHVRIVVLRLCIVDPRKPNILWSISYAMQSGLPTSNQSTYESTFPICLTNSSMCFCEDLATFLMVRWGMSFFSLNSSMIVSLSRPGTFVYICRYDLLRQTLAIYSNCNNR